MKDNNNKAYQSTLATKLGSRNNTVVVEVQRVQLIWWSCVCVCHFAFGAREGAALLRLRVLALPALFALLAPLMGLLRMLVHLVAMRDT